MARDIGRAGESLIEQWCALAGITANKSTVDRHGWDLHFEIPHLADISRADGLHQADLECKVQVKTTDTDKMTVSVELSNLRAMATSTMPTFYILLKFAGGNKLVSAHLLHVDEALCKRILARIRKESAKSEKLELNKKTLQLDFKRGVNIAPLEGESLKSEIINCIGSSQADYVINKQGFLRSAGYEGHSHIISMRIDMEHTDKFVRMLLGDDETVEVKELDATVTRFGITESLIGIRSDTAIMSVANVLPSGRSTVIFKNRKSGAASEFDFDVYRGGAMDCIPPEHRVVRLRSTCFSMDVSIYKNTMDMYFHVDDDASYDVTELLKGYKLIQLLADPTGVRISMRFGGQELNGTLGGEGFGRGFDGSVEMLEAAIFVKNFYGYLSELHVRPSWFERHGTKLVRYKNIIDQRAHLGGMTFEFNVVGPPAGSPTEDVDCLVALPVVIDGKCFVSLAVFHGPATLMDDGSYKAMPVRMTIIYKTYFTTECLVSGSAMEEIEEAAKAYESNNTVVPFLNQFMDSAIASAKHVTEKKVPANQSVDG